MTQQHPIVLFDDGRGRFGPLVDLRAAFELRTGADTTVRRVSRWAGERLAALWPAPGLKEVVRERAGLPVGELPRAAMLTLLNGRLPLPDAALLPAAMEAVLEAESGDLVAATLPADLAAALLRGEDIPPGLARREAPPGTLLRRPWDLLRRLGETIAFDAMHERPRHAREAAPAVAVGDHAVSIHASARLWPGVVIDAEQGPVIVHENAVVRPGAVLCGPCVIGLGATIAEHAIVRPRTVVGPMCKVGGEISAVVFQGWSNKAHDGFLGDTVVGKWVNIGAGATNSNLLNTYGEVVMRLDAEGARERTGTQFMGAVIGDHAKLAIGTRLMTGTTLGTGAMVACTAPPPAYTPAFAWLTDEAPDGSRRFRWDRFEESMRAMMARRRREPGAAYLAKLRELWEEGEGRREKGEGGRDR